jgi:hypothetical protein
MTAERRERLRAILHDRLRAGARSRRLALEAGGPLPLASAPWMAAEEGAGDRKGWVSHFRHIERASPAELDKLAMLMNAFIEAAEREAQDMPAGVDARKEKDRHLLRQTYRVASARADKAIAAEKAVQRGRKGAAKRAAEAEKAKAEVLSAARALMKGEGLRGRFRSARKLAQAISTELEREGRPLGEDHVRTILMALKREDKISWLLS